MALANLFEQIRLRAHFRTVLGELAARDVSHLARPERAVRERLVAELARYASAGTFPRNDRIPDRPAPYFVDAHGTRCALAHLVEATGERALVDRIRQSRNNAYVRELASDRALRAWLGAAGLTPAEAARIQPAYCFVTKADACVCNQAYGADGVLIATVTGSTIDGVMARVDSIHGMAGAITVGQTVTIRHDGAHPGDTLLVPVDTGGATPQLRLGFRLDGSEVQLSCEHDVPALATSDAIAAILAGSESDACSMHLASLNATWGQSQCDTGPPDDGGCTATAGGSPLALGAALAAALVSIRRRPA